MTTGGTADGRRDDPLDLWVGVVDPQARGMPAAIASDIASYTGEAPELVLEKMATGTEDLKRLWDHSGVDPSDSGSVASFYRNQFVEAYELANWHCGRTNGAPPLNYARAALFARRMGLKRALDFGSGIGTGSLCLASVGCEVHSADIAADLLKFVGYRMESRGFGPRLIDLNTSDRPPKAYFDLVTCFDVLEHVPDQMEKLLELQSYLRIGGYLFINLLEDSTHPDRPMHISSSGNRVAMIRKTAMRPLWSEFHEDLQVLARTRGAWALNRLARLLGR